MEGDDVWADLDLVFPLDEESRVYLEAYDASVSSGSCFGIHEPMSYAAAVVRRYREAQDARENLEQAS